MVDETERTPDRKLSIQSATVLSTFVDSHEMKVFKIIEGSPGRNIRPQRTHLILPENGFRVTEPYGNEVMLYPSIEESWKYILRFENREEAIIFARIMSSYSEDQALLPLSYDVDWFSTGYFTP